jgi:hypothetical protein
MPDVGVRELEQRAGEPAVPFLTFDLRQAQAARAPGFTVVGA